MYSFGKFWLKKPALASSILRGFWTVSLPDPVSPLKNNIQECWATTASINCNWNCDFSAPFKKSECVWLAIDEDLGCSSSLALYQGEF